MVTNKRNNLKEVLAKRNLVLLQQRKAVEQIGSHAGREIELLLVDVKTPSELTPPSPVQAAEVFLKEIGQKQLADQCVELNGQLRKVHNLVNY